MSAPISKFQNLITDFRPEFFRDLIGQAVVLQQLQNMIAQDQLPYGLLFVGDPGSGKTTMARLVVKAVQCRAWEPGTYEPCGECDICRKLAGNLWNMNTPYYGPGRLISEERFLNNIWTVKGNGFLWDTRKAALFIDDLDSLPKRPQLLLRNALDTPWPGGLVVATSAYPDSVDAPLRDRMLTMPVTAPTQGELVVWIRRLMVEDLKLDVADDTAVVRLVRVARLNFRAILKMTHILYVRAAPVTATAVDLVAMQCGYS